MLEVLKLFNYIPPKLEVIKNDFFEIKKYDNGYKLFINGEDWMEYEDDHLQACQLFSHYYIASGDVIVTGLGFAVRENWLLNNPKVKSLTILEKSEKLIEYHKQINPILFEKANIICCDAKTYKGKCDTLLLDHYSFETTDDAIKDVINICKNIKCRKMWFWHLESQILADLHQTSEHGIWNKFRSGNFKINVETLKNIKKIYDSIKVRYGLTKLPDLTIKELQLILTIYTSFFQRM